MKLSICFTVYGQLDMLKERLDTINRFNVDNVEVLISDDSASNEIEFLVNSYNNPSFRYIRTPHRLGHDLNILYAVQHAAYDHVMVLRTRDNVCMEAIDEVLATLANNPNAGYWLFSAVDEEGSARLRFAKKTYKAGDAALKAHFELPAHPSGNIYNRRFLNISLYKEFLNIFFDDLYGFDVHSLMRLHLAAVSDCVTSDVVGWVYTDTLKSKDVAVNSAPKGQNVYEPRFYYPRYCCEFMFARCVVTPSFQRVCLERTIDIYYKSILLKLRDIIRDPRYTSHYNSIPKDYRASELMTTLRMLTEVLVEGMPAEDAKLLKQYAASCELKYSLLFLIRSPLRNALVRLPLYGPLRHMMSQIVH